MFAVITRRVHTFPIVSGGSGGLSSNATWTLMTGACLIAMVVTLAPTARMAPTANDHESTDLGVRLSGLAVGHHRGQRAPGPAQLLAGVADVAQDYVDVLT